MVVQNIWRWLLLVLLQVLILRHMQLEGGIQRHLQIVLYPLFFALLPIRTPLVASLFLAFFTGLFVDFFYNSLGVHASACVFMTFMRPLALNVFEPREGYSVNQSPTKKQFGLGRFLGYASALLLGYLFFYFSVEAFTFVYIGTILLKTLLSFLGSLVFILIYMLIFDPVQ